MTLKILQLLIRSPFIELGSDTFNTMKGTTFWDAILCSLVQVHRNGQLPSLQSQIESYASNQQLFKPEDEASTFLCTVGDLLPNYTASCQSIVFFTVTAVTILHPTPNPINQNKLNPTI
jgi:hypothetical protein